MGIYHFNMKIIGRSRNGSSTAACAYISGSVVAGAAYRSGEKIHNNFDGKTHDYTQKNGVVYSEIMLPENAPREFLDRSTLWNAVEKKNNRRDAQLAREFNIALPIEFTREEQIDVIREFITKNLTDKGICADFSIHDKGDGNPHAHILFTMDSVSEKGFGKRLKEEKAAAFYQQKKRLIEWRKSWADICNEHYREKGLKIRIDHRTLEAQGIDRLPTIHLGKEACQLERKGIPSERGDMNRKIIELNAERNKIERQISRLETNKRDINELRQKVEELQKKRTNTKDKKSKREIDWQIKHLEDSIDQTISKTMREMEQIGRLQARENIAREADRVNLVFEAERQKTIKREIVREITHTR